MYARLPRKLASGVLVPLIGFTSAVVFCLLDVLDVTMCFFFRILDGFLEGEGESSSCYCSVAQPLREDEGDGESELSETLYVRANVLRDLLMVGRTTGVEKRGAWAGKGNRWSDCGCESCISWVGDGAGAGAGADFRLHVFVREPEGPSLGSDHGDTSVQNVIFIHGFLSSSSIWKETVFPNLSEHSKKNCRLFAIDLLGFGKSPKPRNCFYTLRDHLEMIEKSIILPYGVNSFHLVAHSMGCVIALALAASHSGSVKSVTLIAPPYFSSEGNAASEVLRRLATRRIWPPLLFGSAFMSWYEHLGRCVCFFFCRNHRFWEWLIKLLTRQREVHFSIADLTCHTHHSAWHTMHNVICGGAKLLDRYLEALGAVGVKIDVIQGTNDQVVPVECSYRMKAKAAEIELELVPNADHNSVLLDRAEEFTVKLERLWDSCSQVIRE